MTEDDVRARIAFFADARSRVDVLRALSDGPASRSDVVGRVDASRTTLWRTLTDLRERGYVREEDGVVAATTRGRVALEAVESFCERYRAADRLDDLLEHLPVDEMDVDVGRLADAEIARPSPADPMAPMRLAGRLVAEGEDLLLLSHAWDPGVLRIVRESLSAGAMSITMVVTEDVVAAIAADATTREDARAVLAADPTAIQVHAGDVPHILAVVDGERVGLGVDDEQGRPQAVLASDDEAVVEWAAEVADDYRRNATPVDPERFSP